MLAFRRGQSTWTEVVHKSGDVLRFCVSEFKGTGGPNPTVKLTFDDDARNFDINRPERIVKEGKG